LARITNDKLEKFRLNFSRCVNRDVAFLTSDFLRSVSQAGEHIGYTESGESFAEKRRFPNWSKTPCHDLLLRDACFGEIVLIS